MGEGDVMRQARGGWWLVVVLGVCFPMVASGAGVVPAEKGHRVVHRQAKVDPWEYENAFLLAVEPVEGGGGVEIEAFIPLKNLTDPMVDATAAFRATIHDPAGGRHTWRNRQAVTAGFHLRYPRDFTPAATWPTPGRHRLLLSVDGQRVWDATFELHDGHLAWWKTGDPDE